MRYVTLFLILAAALTSCIIKAPEVSITGEKTALEEQVLGDYRQIESDTWMIASARTTGSSGAGTSATRQDVFAALQNRKFNKDEIDQFKLDRSIGENRQGFVEVLNNEKYNRDALYRKWVDQVIEEENRDRKIIYEQIIAAQKNLSKEQLKRAYWIFAKQNHQASPKGTMIQSQDGSWAEKE